jgi:hypothetical protein
MYVLTQTKGKLKLEAASPTRGTETGGSHSDPKSVTRAAIAAVSAPSHMLPPHARRPNSLAPHALMRMQVNAAVEGKFEDVEVAWGGQPVPRQLAEFKFKQVVHVARRPQLCFKVFTDVDSGNGHSLRIRQGQGGEMAHGSWIG